jgi:hypothetical protein
MGVGHRSAIQRFADNLGVVRRLKVSVAVEIGERLVYVESLPPGEDGDPIVRILHDHLVFFFLIPDP